MTAPTVTEPAAQTPAVQPPVLVFDGVCLLCSAWVDFVLRHDRGGRICFAAMQGEAGRSLLRRHGLDADDPLSFLYVSDGRALSQSDAVLRLLADLGGIWRLSGVLRLLPRSLRDAGYRLIARNRYRWFGRREHCLLPAAAVRARFLD